MMMSFRTQFLLLFCVIYAFFTHSTIHFTDNGRLSEAMKLLVALTSRLN